VLWATRDDEGLFEEDGLARWRAWATNLRGGAIDSGHHVAEEAPVETAATLAAFWAEVGWTSAAGAA
jgi:haloacetate dehalogenase